MSVKPNKILPPGLKPRPAMVSKDCTGGDGGVMSRSVTVKMLTVGSDKAGTAPIESNRPGQRIEERICASFMFASPKVRFTFFARRLRDFFLLASRPASTAKLSDKFGHVKAMFQANSAVFDGAAKTGWGMDTL